MLNNYSERLRARPQPGLDVDPVAPAALTEPEASQQFSVAVFTPLETYCEFSDRQFQTGAATVAPENSFLTDWRESTTIVNTPRMVPKGIKRHSMQAITSANE